MTSFMLLDWPVWACKVAPWPEYLQGSGECVLSMCRLAIVSDDRDTNKVKCKALRNVVLTARNVIFIIIKKYETNRPDVKIFKL